MKRLLAIAAALPISLIAFAENGKEPSKDVVIKGELVDLTGYLMSGHRGAEHADEAEADIRGGAPAAVIADDGTAYVILVKGNEGREPMKYVAHVIEITGTVHEKDGTKGVFAKSVKDLGEVKPVK